MMQKTEKIWHNGQFVPWEDAKIHVLTHALHYGGSAFEGIRFYETDRGPAIFRLIEHVDRLFYSAKTLKMELPYSREEIIEAIKELVRSSNLKAGYIRPIAFYGYGKLGVNPVGNPVELVIACWPWGAYLPYESIDIKTSKYIRIHPDSTVVDAKLAGHYVNGILASLELQGTHYHEALFLDSEGYITEGVGENFFMAKDGVIYTPKLGSILAGITRDTIITLARHLGFKVVEKDLVLDDAYQAEEAFFTGTAAEVTLIRSINDKVLAQAQESKIGSRIKEAYLDLVHGRSQDFIAYFLTFVDDD
ncbi:Branched-chain-amino-acid aminotransferase [Legionella massiliensis]|uniref:Branched-chain-amino-acid aminotransferase n=1 Tax=Legionella massiliensis TaxID=1034943 RepID=A0A078L1G5_9GAMM|nr:branched-chain amino acid transaminase [Legionella massiliensis]CDZ77864.1 Branched-chain-amino-acid aminotransferase [Legionella massiliensis]CEE13602.1 Branched-chain-amino-acid aminotransferase [Legionella massiliensis]